LLKGVKSYVISIQIMQLYGEIVKNEIIENQDREEKRNQSSRTSRKINWRLRAMVLIRDNCICIMCGASPSKDPSVVLHVDHVKTWSKGGETYLENLQTLCSVCNIGKSDETI